MNDAQIWTIIGVLGATIVGMVTFGFTMLLQTMRAELRAGFDHVNTRLDAMDKDINALMKQIFGVDRG